LAVTPELLLPGDHKAPRRSQRSSVFYSFTVSKQDCYLPAVSSWALGSFSSFLALLK